MPNRSDDTKRRFLDAARDEFATFGIAGARTGRIAMAAGANEALLYRYFGSKRALFTEVYASLVQETIEDVPLNAADLGSYAGALFDYYRTHDHVLRLAVWAALETPDAGAPEGIVAATTVKIAEVAAAQRAGLTSDRLSAGELLALVIQLSLTGASVSPALGSPVATDIRRKSVVAAARLLAAPAGEA